MGVGGCEIKTIGYTCRSVVLKVFGPGFNSRRLHHTKLRLIRRVRSNRGGVVLFHQWLGFLLARPRTLNVRGDISLPPVKYDRTSCVPPAFHRLIVMDAGG